jgi:putative pre-16S rRNA nuclease
MALSDRSWFIATPYKVTARKVSKLTQQMIKEEIELNDVCGIVIGLPLNSDGSEGNSCEKIRRFITKTIEPLGLPVFLQDERFSSQAANEILKHSNYNRKKRAAMDDMVAASIILQHALEFFPS